MSRRKISDRPVRTCLGCRRKLPQDRLYRLVIRRHKDHYYELVWDIKTRLRGRGAWICRDNPGCLVKAAKPGLLARAFKLTDGPVRITSDSLGSLFNKEQVS
ncbi:MAG: YlxR family protein [Deltaproteobacteria bacterium]|nr:YlxR family protein [Deltaproteobacteria bacterium]